MIISGNKDFLKKYLDSLENFLFITDNYTFEFSNIFQIPKEKNYFLNLEFNEKKVFSEIDNDIFLTRNILLKKLEKNLEETKNNLIKDLSSQYLTISPLGVINSEIKLNLTEIIDFLPSTKIVNEEIINIHKIHCIFSCQKTILLTIFLHGKFLSRDLQEFLFLENIFFILPDKDKIYSSLEDTELNIEIKNKYKVYKKNNFLNTYLFLKKFFNSKKIKHCNCFLISYKNKNKYNFYSITYPFLSLLKKNCHLRHINLILDKPYKVENEKKFYLHFLLNFKVKKNLFNISTKPKTLKKKKKILNLDLYY